jgi:hypothetical protein
MLGLSFNLGDIYPEYTWSPLDYTGRITESTPSAGAMRLPIPAHGADYATGAIGLVKQELSDALVNADAQKAAAAQAELDRLNSARAGAVEGNAADSPLKQ